MEIFSGNPRKVIVSREEVNAFRATWPCCSLRDRSYWFEFDAGGDLVDTDVPEQDDGLEASALAQDAKEFLEAAALVRFAVYSRQQDAERYAEDLAPAFPKRLGLTFQAVPWRTGYAVKATDSQGRTYYVTARARRIGDANFIDATGKE